MSGDKSALVEIMDRCRQANTWTKVDKDPCGQMALLGRSKIKE